MDMRNLYDIFWNDKTKLDLHGLNCELSLDIFQNIWNLMGKVHIIE